jgi:predicted nucleotidyltransferase
LASIVAAVPPLLRQSYGEALLAVVLFGFVARGTPHPHSDSDWLVVVRQRGCEEARRALAPELAAAAGLLSEPQFHLRSAAEAEQGGPVPDGPADGERALVAAREALRLAERFIAGA